MSLLIALCTFASCKKQETFTCHCFSFVNGGFEGDRPTKGEKGKGQEACSELASQTPDTECTLK
jgi:hypothetical protein